MRWLTGTIEQFGNYVRNKRWFLYGAGGCYEEIQERCGSILEGDCPCAVIDRNAQAIGKERNFFNRRVPLITLSESLKCIRQGDVLLLSMYHFENLLDELETLKELEDVDCFIYDAIKREDSYKEAFDVRMDLQTLNRDAVQRIPKNIHYCWFGGGKMPEESIRYIEGWQKLCPDYRIMRWDESNYDVTKSPYMKQAYQEKKWAFVSDYARLDVVNTYGGIYLDADVELVQPLDILLGEEAFCGFQNSHEINFGVGFGAKAGHTIIKELIEFYDSLEWDGGKIACPVYQTRILQRHGIAAVNGFQRIEQMTVLPATVLCGCDSAINGEVRFSETIAIHHFHGSWYPFSRHELALIKWFEQAESCLT